MLEFSITVDRLANPGHRDSGGVGKMKARQPDVQFSTHEGVTHMGFDFFRKERLEVFNRRFTIPSRPDEAYSLKSHIIFEAKNANGEKQISVTFGNKNYAFCVIAYSSRLFVLNKTNKATGFSLSETEMDNILTARQNSLEYAVAAQLCKDHTNASLKSPLISGCIVNNFAMSQSYDGYKLHLRLRLRKPFRNPFVSGLEKEYFLIRRVLDTECEIIHFLGRTGEHVNEIVNPYGSIIPRPARTIKR
jgi:hypothetical protein